MSILKSVLLPCYQREGAKKESGEQTDPSELERTYTLSKQPSWFTWVCSQDLNEFMSTIISFNRILLSVNNTKNIYTR